MSKPIVAIVGRPNVGKSTLFNALAGERISIVKDTPGVTRDRIYAEVTWLDKAFTMIDTGGIEPESKDVILSQMREQAQIAIDTADVIIFMTDVKQGLVDADAKVADMLRRSNKPVVLVVNKVDSFQKFMMDTYEFYNLGIGEPVPISAASMLGLGDMLEKVVAHFDEHAGEEEESDIPKIAVVGKPNVGKSSLINKILGEDRVIVSNIAGTTRDAIDTLVEYNGKEYTFIDTAGLRRKNKIKEELERYSIIRTVTAVERADVVVMMIDATEGVTEQDAKIAGIAHDRGKGVVIAVNKWDAIEKNDKTIYKFTNKVRETLSYMPYAEIMFISAQTGQRIPKLFETIDMVLENQTLRIQTGVLNEIVTEAIAMQQPPSDKGKRLKIFYTTQVAVKPPTFVIFVNDKELMHFSYTRYLENKIREAFGFKGTSLKFIIRERKEGE
ncbi:MAG TPA: ribosome biogenesis GTPase Der [Candidatus Blautia stercoravium]|nr:ribosome biogenesis GTPase Der [Candidatus Blautia stercoravium]